LPKTQQGEVNFEQFAHFSKPEIWPLELLQHVPIGQDHFLINIYFIYKNSLEYGTFLPMVSNLLFNQCK